MNHKTLLLTIVFIIIFALNLNGQGVYVNYAEALQKSIYFFDAEMCGFTGTNKLEWRGPCHLEDGEIPLTPEDTNLSASFISANEGILDPDGDGLLNLIGGFHDAGDHVQFGLPQGYTASTLGWGLYAFKQAYIDTDTYDHMLEILKYFTDFFLRCTFRDAGGNVIAYCYQTGNGSIDHPYWGPPELQDPEGLRAIGQNGITYDRPGWFAYSEIPGSDVCGDAAASLVAMYFNYMDIDAGYANECLDTAIALYDFAVANRGCADSGGYYGSAYDYDELSWAAVWLYEATGDMNYIDDIMSKDTSGNYTGYMQRLMGSPGDTWVNIWVHCWDVVWAGAFVKLSVLFPDNTFYDYLARWNLEYWSGGEIPHEDPNDGTYLQYTPAGYAMINTWGSARYNTAAQLCALIYGKNHNRTDFANWAQGQMTYIMGDNPMARSYIVGYNPPYAEHPHHRAAHGSFTNNSMFDPVDHRHILWGALASGPDGDDVHVDAVSEYAYNEVAIDYNAGFVGALAGLYDAFGRDAGHQPIADFPPPEPDVQQFWMYAKLEQENLERTQVTLQIHGVPCHLPAPLTGVTCRYFFNISELIAADQTIADVSLDIYYDQMESQFGGKVADSGPHLWNEEDNIYYVEFDWSNGGIIGARDLQFGLVVKQGPDWESHWDPTNDYSRDGITDEFVETLLIPVYNNGILEYGIEPDGGSVTPTSTPEPTPTPESTPLSTPVEGVLMGDVNTSGSIDIVDALLIARYYVGLEVVDFNPEAGDVSGDGSINIVDALLVAQCYVGLISCDF